MSSSPWDKIVVSQPVNLQDVMLEERNKNYQEKEDRKYGVFAFSENEEIKIPKESLRHNEQLRSDEEVAKMLQHQYDKENDISKQAKGKFNSAFKLSLTLHDTETPFNFDSEDEELEDVQDKNEWDKLGTVLEKFDPVPAYNSIYDSGNLTPRSNILQVNNESICEVISFPWKILPGSGIKQKIGSKREKIPGGWRICCSELVYMPLEFGVDDQTKMILYKMTNDGLIKEITGLISLGEDVLILHARTNLQYKKRVLPAECAIKIFKITFGESKRKDRFLKHGYKFKGMQRRPKELYMIKTACYWAQKEMHILQRLQKAGVPCPEIIALKRNILVMSYLNDTDNTSNFAPKLKDALLYPSEMLSAYEQVTHYMNVMYNECNLIHGDLSETNILWHDNKCYIIDVSHFVSRTHEQALLLLYNDCESISKFFRSKVWCAVPNVARPKDLFINITGYDPKNRFIWVEYQKSLKAKSFSYFKSDIQPNYNFANGQKIIEI